MTSPANSTNEAIQAVLAWLERALTGLSIADWVLLGVAASLGYYLWAGLRAVTRLGPVEVLDLQSDDEKLEAKGLTAALREHLAIAGLMPSPEVPGGAPQTAFLAAVEASPIPQANWIAAIVRMIPRPRPPSYSLKGTLRARKGACPCGVTYWLQETVDGTHTEVDTTWKANYPDAVHGVASSVYIAITTSAVLVYPRWSRWSNREAFECYSDGLITLLNSRGAVDRSSAYNVALGLHRKAERGEPRNLLPQLQIANIVEKQAALAGGAEDQTLRITAVLRYLDIVDVAPSLVEARYRASVLLSMLAADAEQLDAEQTATLKQRFTGSGSLRDQLSKAANDESGEAVKWLGRTSTLRKHRRMRHRFEPKGADRKRLRATIRISRFCQRARQMRQSEGWWQWCVVLARQEAWHVRVVGGLLRLSGQGGWQIPYNAASLYAVMYALTPHRKRWCNRAFARLDDVIEDPLAELREDWLVKGDPDLASLRSLPEWSTVVRRYCRGSDAAAAVPQQRKGAKTPTGEDATALGGTS